MSPSYGADNNSVVEFQLGNRQLLLLFVGLLVICAIFFFIGLRVGEDTARSHNAITIADDSGDEAPQPSTEPPVQRSAAANRAGSQRENRSTVVRPVQSEQQPGQSATLTQPDQQEAAARQPEQQSRDSAADAGDSEPATAQRDSSSAASGAPTSGWCVQVLATPDANKARQLSERISSTYPSYVQQVTANGRLFNRVRVGPFTSRDMAQRALQRLRSEYKDAFIEKI